MLLRVLPRALIIALGVFLLLWQPEAAWIERVYSNGAYPVWEHIAYAITHVLPWSLGDVAGLLGVALVIWSVVAFVRLGRGKRTWAKLGMLFLDIATIAAVYAAWFELSWGWNYARAPIETRVVFDESRLSNGAADAMRARAISEMNRLAVAAHAESETQLDLTVLQSTWLPAVQRVGDAWAPQVGEPKPTIANPFMQATGTSGFINPLTLTVQLAGDVLWFERPFALSHEWSHVAAYAREDEANYLAILTCVRSSDPRIEYSGWLETFLYLPPKRGRYSRRTFSPLVWADFAAMRARDQHHINELLARWSWNTYNAYLKGNRIASGVYNYNEVSRLLLGAPLDAQGLPQAR